MKNKTFKLIAVLIIISQLSTSCRKAKLIDGFTTNNLEIPSTNGNQIVKHFAYTLQYNEEHEQADWVAYVLTRDEVLSDSFPRTDDFREDPEIISQTANSADYSGSGYDRGHLAPAGDMKWSETAMSESFYYSNMSPQTPGLNRGKWETLESQVRTWADNYGTLYIATGGVLKSGLTTIGANKVSVPQMYYKVILDYDNQKAIGFIMKNMSLTNSLISYSVSVDSVEAVTGIDFFPNLPDVIETTVEKETNFSKWNFSK